MNPFTGLFGGFIKKTSAHEEKQQAIQKTKVQKELEETLTPDIQQEISNALTEFFEEYKPKECNRLTISDRDDGTFTGSRIGGVPYFDTSCEKLKEVSKFNDDLRFFVQINLSELKVRCGLPSKGILQFWISEDVGSYQDHASMVVYYPNIDKTMKEAVAQSIFHRDFSELVSKDIEDMVECDKGLYSIKGAKITFYKGINVVNDASIFIGRTKASHYLPKWNLALDRFVSQEFWKYMNEKFDKYDFTDVDNVGGEIYFTERVDLQDIEFANSDSVVLLQLEKFATPIMDFNGLGILRFTLSEKDLKAKAFNKTQESVGYY